MTTTAKTSFNSGEEVGELDYDFTKHITDGRADAKAILPEPSGGQIKAFREIMEKTYPTKTIKATNAITGLEETREVLDMEQIIARSKADETALEAETIEGLSTMFSGTPSAQTISDLPYRVQRAFFGFIYGVFFNPED